MNWGRGGCKQEKVETFIVSCPQERNIDIKERAVESFPLSRKTELFEGQTGRLG